MRTVFSRSKGIHLSKREKKTDIEELNDLRSGSKRNRKLKV
jgi:hypothetical protein